MVQEPLLLARTQPEQGLQVLFPLPHEFTSRAGPYMSNMDPGSPVGRERSPDSLGVHTPPQSEGLKAGVEQTTVKPFPIFAQAQAPVLEQTDTHSLALSWVPVRQTAVGGSTLDKGHLLDCAVSYSLEMQLVGTVSQPCQQLLVDEKRVGS